ncbi:MAG: metal ABC transporter permease [Flavobacteriaceae bacterium]|nr:metal ABC transporter permease [Flavobacteriaceae bacterium]
MSSFQIEIQIIAVLVALACAIPGVFLVLRKNAMVSDAISHSILPGIVVGFFLTQDINSPILILLAAITGLLTVFLVEWIHNTGLVKEDTSIGLVFPALFSIGVLLISRAVGNVHLDIDAVLLGELVFAPFDRFYFDEADWGPKSFWVMGSILLVNLILLLLFYKELKISTFDAGLAAAFGFSPILIHYILMFVSSVTIVGAFDAVGSVLVVGLIIVPAAIANLFTNSLRGMIVISMFCAATAAVLGYWVAHWINASIAGTIMVVLGVFFILSYLFSPEHGRIIQIFRMRQQKEEIYLLTMLLHLQSHEDKSEKSIMHLQEHINWTAEKSNKIIQLAQEKKLIKIQAGMIVLTPNGEAFSESKINEILRG